MIADPVRHSRIQQVAAETYVAAVSFFRRQDKTRDRRFIGRFGVFFAFDLAAVFCRKK